MSLTDFAEPEITDEIDPDRKKLAFEVYQQTWADFYRWEQQSSGDSLKALGAVYPGWNELENVESTEYDNQEFHPEFIGSSAPDGPDTFTVELYDEAGDCIRYATITSDDFTVLAKNLPHPKYEICTPASQNHVPATALYDAMAAFVPYADDPDFPALEYLEDFEEFSWQDDFENPDCKLQPFIYRKLCIY